MSEKEDDDGNVGKGGRRMLSPTQIASFLACPRKWYYQYVEKLPIPEKFPLVRGQVVHSVCEDFFGWRPDPSWDYDTLLEQMRAFAHSLLKEKWAEAQVTEKFGDDRWEETVGMIDRFLQLHQWKMDPIYQRYGDPSKAWYFTRPKFRELHVVDEDLAVRGYIDAVIKRSEDEVILVDYKTSSMYRHSVSEEHQQQLYIYALLYERLHGVRPNHVSVEFLLYGHTANYPVREEFLEEARRTIEDVHSRTTSGDMSDYETNTSYKFCKWCDFREPCQGKPPR